MRESLAAPELGESELGASEGALLMPWAKAPPAVSARIEVVNRKRFIGFLLLGRRKFGAARNETPREAFGSRSAMLAAPAFDECPDGFEVTDSDERHLLSQAEETLRQDADCPAAAPAALPQLVARSG